MRGFLTRIIVLLCALFCSLAISLSGQVTGTIRGTVSDRVTERVLTGARIFIQALDRQGVADNAGNYLIRSAPTGTHTISVRMVGYRRVEQTVTVVPNRETIVNFSLDPIAIEMSEVIVTGTSGGSEARTLGSSVSSLRVEEFVEVAPITSVTELLTARTPGLTLVANSGQAGSSSNVRIRGAGSIYGGYQPLFLIDGILIESGNMSNSTNGTVQGGTALDFINPQDIESIEVIKGPAAATLYGAAAAPGVIQIITKKGRRGQEGVRWTSSIEMGEVEWTEAVGSPKNYWRCTVANQTSNTYPGCQVLAGNRDSLTDSWWGRDANGDPVERWDIPAEDWQIIPGTVDAAGNPTTEYLLQDDPLRRHPATIRKGSSLDYNLSASGGGQSFSYFLSVNRNEEDGVFLNNFTRRSAGRANFDFNVAETLDMSVQFSYARTALQQPLNNNASNSILRNAFRGRARATNDPWEAGFRGFSPWLSNEFDQRSNIERMTIGVTTNWDPFSWFQNNLTLGLDRQNYRRTDFTRIDTTGAAPWGTIAATGTISHFLPITHMWTVNYSGSLDFDVTPDWNSRFSAGMQMSARQRRTTTSSGEGLVANNLNLVSSAAVTTGGESFSEQTSLGLYVQEGITWRDRLTVTGALRFDDNSAFGSDFSLVTYPKASVAWMLSDEEFYNIGFMDGLKLRFAWGKAGTAPAPFEADRTYTTGNTTIDNAVVNLLLPSKYGNPSLQSETGSEWETGFDASLLNGRMALEFTYYSQHTKDALISVPDPGSTGFTGTHLVNIGELANSGLEVLLTGSPIYARNLAWDISLAIATNKNELVSFNGVRDEVVFGSFADVQRHREGYPLGGFWGYDVARDASGQPDTMPVAGYVQDARNMTVLSKCTWTPNEPGWNQDADCDDIYIGPSLPTKEIGLTNTFTLFGNLRIFTQFDYRGGHYQWCAICSIRSRSDLDTWDINTGGTDLNPDVSDLDVDALRSLQTLSHISAADFIKLRELSLTYQLPASWGSIFSSSRWSFTLSGRNLWMWTKYEGTGDPEVQFNANDSFTRLDYASTPQTRRLSAAMRVSF